MLDIKYTESEPCEEDVYKITEALYRIALYKYEKDPDLYHNDFKIAFYGEYMKVVGCVGDILQGVGK